MPKTEIDFESLIAARHSSGCHQAVQEAARIQAERSEAVIETDEQADFTTLC
jgi:hypothetical protein